MSDATKNSSAPIPTTIGGPLRTATIFSGSSTETSTSANMPRIELQRPADGVFEAVGLHFALDEVRDDFRVRFGLELVPLRLKLFFQLQVVLDDSVVNDDDRPGAVAVGWAFSPSDGHGSPIVCGRRHKARRRVECESHSRGSRASGGPPKGYPFRADDCHAG